MMNKYKKPSFLLYLICFGSLYPAISVAQYNIRGNIKESENRAPVEYATVALYQKDSILVNGTMSDSLGYFALNNIPSGSYALQISMVGYEPRREIIEVNRNTELSELFVSPSVMLLNEVVIKGKIPPVRQDGEKMIIDVKSYMLTGGKNTIDVLRVLPGVIAERETISLMGKNAVIYVDGRPSHMSGTELTNYLSSLQADQIEKVELIANPSARYEAGYSGAIINIKLKKDGLLGVNGSVGINAGACDGNWHVIPNFNFNYKTKKINVFGIYSFTDVNYISKLDYIRKYHYADPPTQYDEYAEIHGKSKFHSYNLGLDYTISSRHALGVLLKGNNTDADAPNNTITKIHSIEFDKIDSSIVSNIAMDRNGYNNQINLNYKWTIDDKGTTLNADVNYMTIHSESDQLIPMNYYDDEGNVLRPEAGNGQYVNQDMDLWSAKADFQRKFWKDAQFEIGMKYDKIERKNDLYALQKKDGVWSQNPQQSNFFNYREQVSGAYFSLSKKFGSFSVNPAIRGEFTNQEGFQVTSNESFSKEYFDLFPSLSVQGNLKENESLSFIYSRKLSRPTFSMLNPFRFYTSPQTFQVGNPNLSPNYYETYTIQYLKKQVNVTFQYLIDKGDFVSEAIQNDVTKELGYHYINFGTNQRYRLSAYVPIQIFRWWNMNLNGSLSYIDMNSKLNRETFIKKYWFYNGSVNNTFNISKGLSAQLYAMYNADQWSSAIHIKSRGYMEASIQQELWKGKGVVSLGVADPFRWSVFRSTYQYQNIDESCHEVSNSRSIKVSFRYNFGLNNGSKNSRKTGVEDVESRSR